MSRNENNSPKKHVCKFGSSNRCACGKHRPPAVATGNLPSAALMVRI